MSNKKNNILSDIQGDKYTTKNPIAIKMLDNFFAKIKDLVSLIDQSEIEKMTECGCGKGQVTQFITDHLSFKKVNSFDILDEDLAISMANNKKEYVNFYKNSIYDIDENEEADLIVCCEVLEHLEDPELALKKMSGLGGKYYLFSVPNEPLWRILNFARGKYMSDWGNTPDHRNHWSRRGFIKFVNQYLDVVEVRKPLPWTMVLAKQKTS